MVFERALTRDIAVDATGRAVETVTSGPSLWTRSASTVAGLDAGPWAFRTLASPIVLGPTGVLHVVLTARGPREEAPDAAGRCVIRATVPTATDPRDVYGELLAGANVLLTLDENRIIVRSAPDDPELVVELDVARVGEPQSITPPHSGR